ncbi:MAG TPA: hypothetical protein VJZ51_00850 [Bacilli bacterium]|nr:hypothetical protein [Bacilli bacterium]
MKKTLLLIALILGLSCFLGCDGCKKTPQEEADPEQILVEGKETYLTVKQGEYSYNITVDEMYINLRNEIGFNTVLNWADKTIVQNFSKRDLYKKLSKTPEEFLDVDDTAYWDLVTEEDIIEDMIAYYFNGNTAGYTDNQVLEILQENYVAESYANGYRNFEDLKGYHHLKLAKYLCITDYYQVLKLADPYTEGQKKAFYNENYLANFWGIIIPFNSYLEVENTLKELGYTISPKNEDDELDFNKWINNETGDVATSTEVVQTLIRLYNETMVKKNDAQGVAEITEGKDYSLVEGKYVFQTANKESILYHLGKNINAANSDLYILMNSLSSLVDSDELNANWYTPRIQFLNDNYYLFLNIAKESPKTYEEAKGDIVAEMIANALNEEEVNKLMAYLRWYNNLVIYDGFIKNLYNNIFEKKVTEAAINHDTYVAILDIKSKQDGSPLIGMYTKKQIFSDMDYRYGPYVALELVNYHNFLFDPKYNNVYDLRLVTKKDEERILNENSWEWVVEDVVLEKANFINGDYTMYGYPSNYGWGNFIGEVYGVRTEKDLALLYLRRDLMDTYINSVSDLTGVNEESSLWEYFSKKMQSIAEQYFKAKGWGLIITYKGADGNGTNPSTWTTEQKALAQEFYRELMEYLEIDIANYDENVDALIYAYSIAPYLLGDNQNPENAVFSGINMAKYKTAGLKLYSIDLGEFSNGKHGVEIDAAAKEIWDKNPASEEPTLYGTSSAPLYIANNDGYYIYISVKCFDLDRIGEDKDRIIPSLGEIQLYLSDEETELLNSEQKQVIQNIYIPLAAELGTMFNVARTLYKEQLDYEFTFRYNTYDLAAYLKVLAINIEQVEAQLIYTK